MKKININSDLGESFGSYRLGMDEEVLMHISSANIACGFHASDPVVMAKTVALAKKHSVHVGAHPGFPDLQGFGRRPMTMSAEEIKTMVMYQIGALDAFCRAEGIELEHVKPHGALYNMAEKDKTVASAICKGIAAVDKRLIVLGSGGSCLYAAAIEHGLPAACEVFADRAYEDDGSLVSRKKPGAVITDTDEVIARVTGMVEKGTVSSVNGRELHLRVDSICVHGDNINAVMLAKALKQALQDRGIELCGLREMLC